MKFTKILLFPILSLALHFGKASADEDPCVSVAVITKIDGCKSNDPIYNDKINDLLTSFARGVAKKDVAKHCDDGDRNLKVSRRDNCGVGHICEHGYDYCTGGGYDPMWCQQACQNCYYRRDRLRLLEDDDEALDLVEETEDNFSLKPCGFKKFKAKLNKGSKSFEGLDFSCESLEIDLLRNNHPNSNSCEKALGLTNSLTASP
jgi:hypothetical protein